MIIKRDCMFTPAGKNHRLHIYLPDDYAWSEERYPVMYFFDGHNLFENEEATYGKSWGLKEFMDSWDKKMIVVGIECSHEGNDRLSEYLPYKIHRNGGFLAGLDGIGDATIRFMIEELKTAIDAEFRTYPFRECTAIGGSSMGGLMALYAVTKYNNWFSKAACVSSAIGFCMPQLLHDFDNSYIDPDTRVYLSWGTKEAWGLEEKDQDKEDRHSYSYRHNKAFENRLNGRGAAVRMYCQVGGSHCEADWEKQVPGFMRFLWQE